MLALDRLARADARREGEFVLSDAERSFLNTNSIVDSFFDGVIDSRGGDDDFNVVRQKTVIHDPVVN